MTAQGSGRYRGPESQSERSDWVESVFSDSLIIKQVRESIQTLNPENVSLNETSGSL